MLFSVSLIFCVIASISACVSALADDSAKLANVNAAAAVNVILSNLEFLISDYLPKQLNLTRIPKFLSFVLSTIAMLPFNNPQLNYSKFTKSFKKPSNVTKMFHEDLPGCCAPG